MVMSAYSLGLICAAHWSSGMSSGSFSKTVAGNRAYSIYIMHSFQRTKSPEYRYTVMYDLNWDNKMYKLELYSTF